MFSPGALSAQAGPMQGGITSHAELDKNCGACHPSLLSGRTMSDLCLTCHSNIQAEIQDSTSLHGVFAKTSVLTCQNCHTEHKGPNGSLTVMSSVSFPHETTGFALTAHQARSAGVPFTCSDCHTESIARFDQQTCTDCHRTLDTVFTTAHRLEFGDDCLACHDGHDRFSNFDHSKTPFALTGKHLSLACSACHLDARTIADLQNTPAACESCHREDDAHEGRFGANCGVCHSPEGWEPAEFDHNLAAFKLEGQHARVKCEQCHLNGVFAGTPQDCYSCHAQDDDHNGQFGRDCAACHNPSNWENATFDHSRSNFPLTGAHVNVACERCHTDGQFKGLSSACIACHAEPAFHAGLFDTDCTACHSTVAWTPARFNGAHTFPLNHGGGASCATCHPSSLTTYTCYGCHEHNETKIRSKHLKEGISNFQDCVRCHPSGQEHEGGEGGEHESDDD